jgi:uncharacterized protein (DUF305 family)
MVRRPRATSALAPTLMIACLLLTVGGLTVGCARRLPPAASPPASSPAVTTPATTFNGTDTAWLQLMIPMTEQAMQLLDLLPRAGAAPGPRAARTLAEVGAAHSAELDRLRALRTRAGLPTTNVHEGHDMPGMMTAGELSAAARTTGTALHRLVTAQLREHLAQSLVICDGEKTSGADLNTRRLADAIAQTRAAQLVQLGHPVAKRWSTASLPTPGRIPGRYWWTVRQAAALADFPRARQRRTETRSHPGKVLEFREGAARIRRGLRGEHGAIHPQASQPTLSGTAAGEQLITWLRCRTVLTHHRGPHRPPTSRWRRSSRPRTRRDR